MIVRGNCCIPLLLKVFDAPEKWFAAKAD